MEDSKRVGSSSSLASDLFGPKDSSSSSSSSSSSKGIFGSVFPPVVGRDSSRSDVVGSLGKQNSGNQVWNNISGDPGGIAQSSKGESLSNPNQDRSSGYQRETVDTCYLGSSIYYGGQDPIYSHSPNTGTSGSHPTLKKDGGEDDPNGNNSQTASRGNWWQGSLYY